MDRNELAASETKALAPPRVGAPSGLLAHTLPSRFLFLIICSALVLSALAYGTVHYWALALFALGGLSIIFLWLADGWRLGSLRISRNALQIPLLGMIALGCFQLLPLRHIDSSGGLSTGANRAFSLDPSSTRLVIVQLVTLLVYFAATLVFIDTPHRLRIIVRTIAI